PGQPDVPRKQGLARRADVLARRAPPGPRQERAPQLAAHPRAAGLQDFHRDPHRRKHAEEPDRRDEEEMILPEEPEARERARQARPQPSPAEGAPGRGAAQPRQRIPEAHSPSLHIGGYMVPYTLA